MRGAWPADAEGKQIPCCQFTSFITTLPDIQLPCWLYHLKLALGLVFRRSDLRRMSKAMLLAEAREPLFLGGKKVGLFDNVERVCHFK